MRIKTRFIGFFTLGLLLFVLYITMLVAFLLEIILPFLGLKDSVSAFATVFFAALVSGGALFSIWFVSPVIVTMSMISEISAGNLNPQKTQKLYRKNGEIKLKYRLYKELLSDVNLLTAQLKQAETEREKLEQAKQDWVRGISHDIKTPLSYVVGYSSLLTSEHSWSEEERRSFLSQIHQKGKYIESLINNLNLSFRLEDHAKPMPLQISTFDLIAFMGNVAADMLNQQTDDEYPISVNALDSNLEIEADEQLLYRAMANLVGNAVTHNPAGTKIQIEVKRDGPSGVIISVCDNGIGMSQETADGLFGKYYDGQTAVNGKKDYAGGLGLSIVKSIVEAHRGNIFAESEEGEGLAVIIHLPLRHSSRQ